MHINFYLISLSETRYGLMGYKILFVVFSVTEVRIKGFKC